MKPLLNRCLKHFGKASVTDLKVRAVYPKLFELVGHKRLNKIFKFCLIFYGGPFETIPRTIKLISLLLNCLSRITNNKHIPKIEHNQTCVQQPPLGPQNSGLRKEMVTVWKLFK